MHEYQGRDRQPIVVCLLFFAKVFLFKWPHTEYVNATQELHHHRHSQMLKPCLPLDIPNQRIPLGDLIEDNNGGASINIRFNPPAWKLCSSGRATDDDYVVVWRRLQTISMLV